MPGIARFSDEVQILYLMIYIHETPGELLIWLYHPGAISSYQVLSGGAILIAGTVIYKNIEGKLVGRVSIRSPTTGSFDTSVATVLANTASKPQWEGRRPMTVQKTGLVLP